MAPPGIPRILALEEPDKAGPATDRRRDRGCGPSWRTFLVNELDGIAAMDLMTVPTVTFDQLYALVVLSLRQRRLVFVTATSHPTALWLAQQIREAFPWDTAPKFLIRDNDKKYRDVFKRSVRALGIRDRPISPRSQSASFAGLIIGTEDARGRKTRRELGSE